MCREALHECKYGFRTGKFVTNLLFIIKMIHEKNWEWNIIKYAPFIDLEKAFDRMNKDMIVLSDGYYSLSVKAI